MREAKDKIMYLQGELRREERNRREAERNVLSINAKVDWRNPDGYENLTDTLMPIDERIRKIEDEIERLKKIVGWT